MTEQEPLHIVALMYAAIGTRTVYDLAKRPVTLSPDREHGTMLMQVTPDVTLVFDFKAMEEFVKSIAMTAAILKERL